jgi:hypothetical protein
MESSDEEKEKAKTTTTSAPPPKKKKSVAQKVIADAVKREQMVIYKLSHSTFYYNIVYIYTHFPSNTYINLFV